MYCLSFVSDLAAQVQHLQSENATLSQQLAVALELGNEFRRLHDIDRIELERWRTYAVEARTFFQTFYDLAKRAHSKAQDAANGEKDVVPADTAGLKAIDAALVGLKIDPEAPKSPE
jgi:hypothetical protein